MKQLTTKGIVLRRTNFGEADRIITVLTTDEGKIRLLAKGVRRIKSKLAGGIELFSINDLTFMRGKSELGTLISSRLVTNFGRIVSDVDRTMFAYEVLKTIDKNTEDIFDEDYFAILAETLDAIDNLDLNTDWIKIWVNIQLLKLSGHVPNLQTDPAGLPLDPGAVFIFSFDDMAFLAHPAGEFDARAIKVLRLAVRAKTPSVLAGISAVDALRAPLAQLTKTMYVSYSRQ